MEDMLIQHSQELSMLATPHKGVHPNSTGGPTYRPLLEAVAERSDCGCQQRPGH